MISRLLRCWPLVACFMIQPPALAQDVAVVNGKPIADVYFNEWFKPQLASQGDSPKLRATALEELVNRAALSQEAERLRLGERPYYKAQIEFARQYILMSALNADYAEKHPIADAEIQAAYEDFKKRSAGDKEYQLWTKVVESEDAAKALVSNLNKGEEPVQPEPAAISGKPAQNWVVSSKLDPPLRDALAGTKKGQVGLAALLPGKAFIVFRIDGERPATVPNLEVIKPQMVEQMQEFKRQGYLSDLRAKARVELPGTHN